MVGFCNFFLFVPVVFVSIVALCCRRTVGGDCGVVSCGGVVVIAGVSVERVVVSAVWVGVPLFLLIINAAASPNAVFVFCCSIS